MAKSKTETDQESKLTDAQRLEKLEAAFLELSQKFEFHTHNRVGEVELRDPCKLSTTPEPAPSETTPPPSETVEEQK